MSIAAVVCAGFGPAALIRYVVTEGFGADAAVGAPSFGGSIGNITVTQYTVVSNFFASYFTGATSYTINNIPAGLSFDTSVAQLYGVPSTAGATSITITGVNSSGSAASNSFTYTVSAAPAAVVPEPTAEFRMGIVGG